MDGELPIMPTGKSKEGDLQMIMGTMESETRCIFEVIRESGSPLATWKMAGPFAGPREVVAVRKLTDFLWTYYTNPEDSTDPYIKERQKIKHTKVPDDARATPCKFVTSKAMGCSLFCYRMLLQTLPLSHRLHLLAADPLERRSNWSNDTSPNQLQCQPPFLRWRHPHNWL